MKPGQSCVICPQADALLLWWHKWAMVVVRDAIMTLEAGRTVFCTIVQYFVVVYIFWALACTISHLGIKNIIIVQALLQTTVGTPIKMEERRLHTNSCNISSLITYAILPMAQKKAFTMLPVFLVAYCKIGIADDDGCWARYIDVILKRQARL